MTSETISILNRPGAPRERFVLVRVLASVPHRPKELGSRVNRSSLKERGNGLTRLGIGNRATDSVIAHIARWTDRSHYRGSVSIVTSLKGGAALAKGIIDPIIFWALYCIRIMTIVIDICPT